MGSIKPAKSEKSEQKTDRKRLATKTAGVSWTRAIARSHIAAFNEERTRKKKPNFDADLSYPTAR